MSSGDDRPREENLAQARSAGVSLSVGDAIGFGWSRFKANAGVWVGIVIVAAIIQALLSALFGERSMFRVDTFGQSLFTFAWILGSILTVVVGYLINAAFVRGALHEVSGQRPGFASFFAFTNVLNVVLACLLVGVLTGIGLVLFIIPGLIVAFLSSWTLQFVLDRHDSAVDGFKSSWRAVSSHAGPLILLALALIGINILGAIPLGLGLLITLPVSVIASTYAYRVVTGGQIAR